MYVFWGYVRNAGCVCFPMTRNLCYPSKHVFQLRPGSGFGGTLKTCSPSSKFTCYVPVGVHIARHDRTQFFLIACYYMTCTSFASIILYIMPLLTICTYFSVKVNMHVIWLELLKKPLKYHICLNFTCYRNDYLVY